MIFSYIQLFNRNLQTTSIFASPCTDENAGASIVVGNGRKKCQFKNFHHGKTHLKSYINLPTLHNGKILLISALHLSSRLFYYLMLDAENEKWGEIRTIHWIFWNFYEIKFFKCQLIESIYLLNSLYSKKAALCRAFMRKFVAVFIANWD